MRRWTAMVDRLRYERRMEDRDGEWECSGEDGGWRIEDGRWRIEDGRWNCAILHPPSSIRLFRAILHLPSSILLSESVHLDPAPARCALADSSPPGHFAG